MTRWIAIFIAFVAFTGVDRAYAQQQTAGPGTLEVTIVPAGGTFFTSSDREPSFGNYETGGTVAYNINRLIGVEGEFSGSIGITQDVTLAGLTTHQRTPSNLNYTGNLVLSAPAHSGFVPYVAGGVGGLTMLKKEAFGIQNNESFLTGNVGGGAKWYAANGRWGVRGDYRFIAVRARDDAPEFFGQDRRYGHRVYGAILINALR